MMRIQAADQAVSIRVSGERPPEGAALARLVRTALARRGLTPWATVECECFTFGQEALIIARPGRDRRPGFYFDELEALLAGALPCAGGDAALYTAGDGYLLAVDRPAAGPSLYEFGRAESVSGDWETHAREQGRCLIRRDALDVLRRYFGNDM